MTYDVLRDYEDRSHLIMNDVGDKVPLTLKVGDKFIPAKTHYPQNLVDKLVSNGTIKLIEKEKPVESTAPHDERDLHGKDFVGEDPQRYDPPKGSAV